MKAIVIALFLINSGLIYSQVIDTDCSQIPVMQDEGDDDQKKVEVLNRGSFDFFTNGKMQGTAQLLKVNIGEPSGFYIPLYLFLGASGDGFGSSELNENTAANLLNPLGGLLNGTFNGRNNLFRTGEMTSLKFSYQLSGKLINAQDSLTGDSKFMGAGYANLGLYFQTGAWEPDMEGNMGIFWIQAKLTGALSFDDARLREVFGNTAIDNYFYGYSVDLGLEINNRINLKAGVYQYLNNQTIGLFDKPVFKFALDYNLKKN